MASLIMTAIITVVSTIAVLCIYKFIINPQIVIPKTFGQCPSMWSFNPTTKMCDPGYTTHCLPFDPTATTLSSPNAKTELAHSCGTDW
jgi:hypothetical protein